MKETPPVLTAGPAAWIRDRARKRSRLLGTRPSRAAGGQAAGRAESTRGAPLSRSGLPVLGGRGKWVVPPPPSLLSPTPRLQPPSPRGLGSLLHLGGLRRGWGSRGPRPAPRGGLDTNLAPQPPEASRQQHPDRFSTKVCTPSPTWSLGSHHRSRTGISDPSPLGVWRQEQQHLETHESQGGPCSNRLRP